MTTSIVDQLGKKANTAIRTGDRFTSNAGKHYLQAGKFLVQAKAKIEHGAWLNYLKRHNIAERTAQTYMALAEGKTTVEEIRANDRERKAAVVKPAGNPADSKKKNASNSDGKSNGKDKPKPETKKPPKDTGNGVKEKNHQKHIGDVLRYAKNFKVEDSDIDDKMISLVEDVAKAWTDLHLDLVQRAAASVTSKVDKSATANSSLH